MFGNLFNGANAHGRQGKGNTKGLGRAGSQNFSIGVLHTGQAGRRNGYGHRHFLAHHGAGCASVFHVDGDALAQFDGLKVRLIGAVSALGPAPRVGVVVKHAGNPLLRQDAQVFNGGDHRHDSLLVWIAS